jgi:hypothetical protein
MSAIRDLSGQRFSRLVAIGPLNLLSARGRDIYWNCLCDCGNSTIIRSADLVRGKTRSCGCLKKEIQIGHKYNLKHGHHLSEKPSTTYVSWMGMKQRCIDPKHISYPRYGGRGIAVCTRWMDFENFLNDMGERPAGLSLDRIDNEGNYESNNC